VPATLPELIETLESADTPCEYAFYGLLTSFAFYDAKDGRVAVRIGLSHGCEVARGNLTQLGIWLDVPDSLREDLARAADGSGGLLMKAAPRRFGGASVGFEWEEDRSALVREWRRRASPKP